ncbi:MAG TPA: hypothetical protein VFF49_10450 [Thermodesulfobacteriota bacterium]|nr:hypothetical protein [Thermodesulfobacteriota bacterium]
MAVLYSPGYTVRLWYSDVAKLIGECRNQHINLENYRGGYCYSKEVQAAEYFLRIQIEIKEISAFRLKEAKIKIMIAQQLNSFHCRREKLILSIYKLMDQHLVTI